VVSGVIDTSQGIFSGVIDHKIGDFKVEYLSEFESTFEKAVAHKGSRWSSLMKKPEVGNLVTQSI
jgi:hypothetical protein